MALVCAGQYLSNLSLGVDSSELETGLGRNKGWWGWLDANEERLKLKVMDLLASELDRFGAGARASAWLPPNWCLKKGICFSLGQDPLIQDQTDTITWEKYVSVALVWVWVKRGCVRHLLRNSRALTLYVDNNPSIKYSVQFYFFLSSPGKHCFSDNNNTHFRDLLM